MKAGVITIPERSQPLRRLLDVVRPEIPDILIFSDSEHRGHWWNYWRMFSTMLSQSSANEPVLLMSDDAITITGFLGKWELIHAKAQSELYTLFGRQRHLFKQENLIRGYVTTVQARGWYDPAAIFINQQDLPGKIREWFYSGGREYMNTKRAKSADHFDLVLQEYLVFHEIPWTITTPTLFDHQDVASSLGHKVGGSPVYIGHENIQ